MQQNTLGIIWLLGILALGCQKETPSILKDNVGFVSVGLNVQVSLDHYPALNEETTLNTTFSVKDWLVDSLEVMKINTVEMVATFFVRDETAPVDSSLMKSGFNPTPGDTVWQGRFSINDTVSFVTRIKPLVMGKFSATIMIHPTDEAVNTLKERIGIGRPYVLLNGSNSIYLCVEENYGEYCP